MPSHPATKDPGKAPQAPSFYGAADLDYNDYLRVDTLLDLQRPQSNPPHHDEMLFIIIHQAYELWFKLTIHEIETAIELLARDAVDAALHFLRRVTEVFRLLTRQIHVLDTMRPVDFLAFRDKLKPASGFQSLQFREVEFLLGLKDEEYLRWFESRPSQRAALETRLAATDLRHAAYGALRRAGIDVPVNVDLDHLRGSETDRRRLLAALRGVYQAPLGNNGHYTFLETLMDLDAAFALWRQHHVMVVERIIGNKRGTGGSSGAAYLRSTTGKRAFPYLWEVRTELER